MIKSLLKLFKLKILSGHQRSVKAKKNILISFVVKGISIVVGFIYVPLILGYLDAERYGIWLTLSSIITWFTFFDIGLGHGLRNRFAEALAKEDHVLAKTYVSTTYAIMGLVFAALILLFLIINPFLNWQIILNTTAIGTGELAVIALIVFVFFILRFYFQLIGTILSADQRPAINNSFGPIGNVLSLIIIIILIKTTEGSLLNLAAVLSITPTVVLFVATFFFFRKDYRQYAPSIKSVDFSKSMDLLGLGFKFFYFQLGRIIFFATTNFLIAQASSQEMVAAYNVAFKYLFLPLMVYTIVLTPFWSAVTDAKARGDFNWIKRSLKKLNLLSILMALIMIILFMASGIVYKLWIGDKLTVPFSLSLVLTLYFIIQVFVAPFSQFISGFGKLKLGIYIITAKLVLFIPLAYIFGNYYGATGIVIAMALIQIPSLVIEPMQTYKIINGTDSGIWSK